MNECNEELATEVFDDAYWSSNEGGGKFSEADGIVDLATLEIGGPKCGHVRELFEVS
jgi:hypothetical protein